MNIKERKTYYLTIQELLEKLKIEGDFNQLGISSISDSAYSIHDEICIEVITK